MIPRGLQGPVETSGNRLFWRLVDPNWRIRIRPIQGVTHTSAEGFTSNRLVVIPGDINDFKRRLSSP